MGIGFCNLIHVCCLTGDKPRFPVGFVQRSLNGSEMILHVRIQRAEGVIPLQIKTYLFTAIKSPSTQVYKRQQLVTFRLHSSHADAPGIVLSSRATKC